MTTMTVPTLTRHDLQERKDRITATDVAAIMGTSPWKTKYDVWIEKCLDMEPIVPSPAMLWGSLMEDDIITYAEARLREHFDDPSIKATRVGIRRKHANGIMSATLDSVLQGRDEAIEAKTHAAIHPKSANGCSNGFTKPTARWKWLWAAKFPPCSPKNTMATNRNFTPICFRTCSKTNLNLVSGR